MPRMCRGGSGDDAHILIIVSAKYVEESYLQVQKIIIRSGKLYTVMIRKPRKPHGTKLKNGNMFECSQ